MFNDDFKQKILEETQQLIFKRAKEGLYLIDLEQQIGELCLKRDKLKEFLDGLDELIDCNFEILNNSH